MVDSCPESIRIVLATSARICSGQDGRRQRGESDSQQLSIPGKKDKNLLSQCQHSTAQRDFIDQRTAMQKPLLHPSDTIYHAPWFLPPSPCPFHSTSIQSTPSCKNRQKNFLKKTKLILLQMIGGLNQLHSNKIRQMDTHPKTPKATCWDLVVGAWINSNWKRISWCPINYLISPKLASCANLIDI